MIGTLNRKVINSGSFNIPGHQTIADINSIQANKGFAESGVADSFLAIRTNYSPIQTEDVIHCGNEGKTYSLITDMGFYLPMYRPSLLEKAGVAEYARTPEEFIEMAKKFSMLDNVNGYAAMLNPGNWSEGSIDLSIWVIGLGGHVISLLLAVKYVASAFGWAV